MGGESIKAICIVRKKERKNKSDKQIEKERDNKKLEKERRAYCVCNS